MVSYYLTKYNILQEWREQNNLRAVTCSVLFHPKCSIQSFVQYNFNQKTKISGSESFTRWLAPLASCSSAPYNGAVQCRTVAPYSGTIQWHHTVVPYSGAIQCTIQWHHTVCRTVTPRGTVHHTVHIKLTTSKTNDRIFAPGGPGRSGSERQKGEWGPWVSARPQGCWNSQSTTKVYYGVRGSQSTTKV